MPSAQVAGEGESILRVMGTVTALDLVAARAKHAAWLGAVRPVFLPQEREQGAEGSGRKAVTSGAIRIHGMRHPILLQVPYTLETKPSPAASALCPRL